MRKIILTVLLLGIFYNAWAAKLFVYNNTNTIVNLVYKICETESGGDIIKGSCTELSTINMKAYPGKNFVEIKDPLPMPIKGNSTKFLPISATGVDIRGRVISRGNFGFPNEYFSQCATPLTWFQDGNQIQSLFAIVIEDMKGSPNLYCSTRNGYV